MRRLSLAVMLAAALLGGCDDGSGNGGTGGGAGGGGIGGGAGGGSGGPSGKTWTVLVYMVASNNLEPFALGDAAEMAQVGSTDSVHIVVEMKRMPGYSSDPLGNLGDFEDARRFVVNQQSFQDLGSIGQPNMGDPNTLADFVSWGMQNFPADKYALVLWDHGGAWPGFGADETAQDDTLTINEMKQALGASLGGKKLALIGFDACLMGTAEVASALSPYAYFLLASEELEPGHGWDYQRLSVIANDPTAGADQLGLAMIDGFHAQAVQAGTVSTITLALTDLSAVGDLNAALTDFSNQYTSQVGSIGSTVGRARTDAIEYGKSPDPSQSRNQVDIGDFFAHLAQDDSRFAASRDAVNAALGKLVRGKTSGSVTQASTGMAVYLPTRAADYNTTYDQLAELGPWRSFVKALLGAGGGATKPAFTSNTAQVTSGANGLTFSGTLVSGTESAVSTATFAYGRAPSSTVLELMGDQPADVSGSTVSATWDKSVLQLSQGSTSAIAYLSVSITPSGDIAATIPLIYKPPNASGQYATRRIVINSSNQITEDRYYVANANGEMGELVPVSGSTFTPIIERIDLQASTDQWVASGSSAFDATQTLNISFGNFASGTTGFGALIANNYAGQGDIAYATVNL